MPNSPVLISGAKWALAVTLYSDYAFFLMFVIREEQVAGSICGVKYDQMNFLAIVLSAELIINFIIRLDIVKQSHEEHRIGNLGKQCVLGHSD